MPVDRYSLPKEGYMKQVEERNKRRKEEEDVTRKRLDNEHQLNEERKLIAERKREAEQIRREEFCECGRPYEGECYCDLDLIEHLRSEAAFEEFDERRRRERLSLGTSKVQYL